MSHKSVTFADAIMLGAQQASESKRPYMFDELARALPKAKRISYDSNVTELIDRFKSVPTEEIFAQFGNVPLPFHTLWIEHTSSALELERLSGVGRSELGFLVRAGYARHSGNHGKGTRVAARAYSQLRLRSRTNKGFWDVAIGERKLEMKPHRCVAGA